MSAACFLYTISKIPINLCNIVLYGRGELSLEVISLGDKNPTPAATHSSSSQAAGPAAETSNQDEDLSTSGSLFSMVTTEKKKKMKKSTATVMAEPPRVSDAVVISHGDT